MLQLPSLIPSHAHLPSHACSFAKHTPLPYMSSATHALATHTPNHNAPITHATSVNRQTTVKT